MRAIEFNAWILSIGLMLESITVYPDGMIGIESDKLEDSLKDQKGDRYVIYDDGVYYKGEKEEDDIFERAFTLLSGDDWYWIEADDCIILEYSGLDDEINKQLFEGDICSNDAALWEVVFNKGCFCGKFLRPTGPKATVGEQTDTHIALRAIKGLRKIGNRYQNREYSKL